MKIVNFKLLTSQILISESSLVKGHNFLLFLILRILNYFISSVQRICCRANVLSISENADFYCF